MNSPDVSVVMSVYNGARDLPMSVDSILCQEGVDFEFIIINDGSTDESARLLEQYEVKDARIRVIHQENCGLTKALIRGCDQACGAFIARQDVGDLSLPGRLAKELALIQADPSNVLVSCGTRFVGPRQEVLFDVVQTSEQAMRGLRTLDARHLRGPSHHGCTLFRADAYRSVGGYRQHFRMAQDVDLWVRLAERGIHLVLPEILYQAEYALQGISAGRHRSQQRIAEMILQGALLRKSGGDETKLLQDVENLSEDALRTKVRNGDAAYFIAMCLFDQDTSAAVNYLSLSLEENPFHLKAWIRSIQLSAKRYLAFFGARRVG